MPELKKDVDISRECTLLLRADGAYGRYVVLRVRDEDIWCDAILSADEVEKLCEELSASVEASRSGPQQA